jgi:hypothetical protein
VFSDAVVLTETYVTPVLERKGFGITGSGIKGAGIAT